VRLIVSYPNHVALSLVSLIFESLTYFLIHAMRGNS
jgi:hypothetical protein